MLRSILGTSSESGPSARRNCVQLRSHRVHPSATSDGRETRLVCVTSLIIDERYVTRNNDLISAHREVARITRVETRVKTWAASNRADAANIFFFTNFNLYPIVSLRLTNFSKPEKMRKCKSFAYNYLRTWGICQFAGIWIHLTVKILITLHLLQRHVL